MPSSFLLALAGIFVAGTASTPSPKTEVSINAHGELSEQRPSDASPSAASLVRKEEGAATIVAAASDVHKVQSSDDGKHSQIVEEKHADAIAHHTAQKGEGDDDDADDDSKESDESADDSDEAQTDDADDQSEDSSDGDMLEQEEEVDRSQWGRRRRSRRRRARRRRAPKPVNCVWGAWKEGKCDKTCGVGSKTSMRTKKTYEKNGGTCEGEDEKTEVCNAGDCPPPPTPAPTPAPTLPVQAFASRLNSVSWVGVAALIVLAA